MTVDEPPAVHGYEVDEDPAAADRDASGAVGSSIDQEPAASARRRHGAHRASRGPALRSWLVATLFGVVWIVVLLMRSEMPPPPEFGWLVLLVVLLVLFVRSRIWSWWRQTPSPSAARWLARATGRGLGVGMIIAIPVFLVGGNAEQLSWFGVLAVVGAVNGFLVGLVARLVRPDLGPRFAPPETRR